MTIVAAQTQLIPFSELREGEAATIRIAAIEKMIEIASKRLNIQPDKLIVRDILPLTTVNDLDYAYLDWQESTGATADVYESMTTGTMGDQRFMAIYGVMVSNNACSALRFNVGGADKAYWMLQNLKDLDEGVGLSPAAIVIPQNTIYTISRFVRAINTPTTIILKGVIVEPRGRLISP